MPSSSLRPPGWYRDPDNPTCVRYWSGRDWSDQRRIRPSWDLPDSDWIAPPLPGDTGGPILEGPARSPWLPAVAAATSARPAPRPLAKAFPPVPGAPDSASRSASDAAARISVVRAPSWNNRRPVLAVVAVALAGLLALAASVSLSRPVAALPWSQTDPQFVIDSNTLCNTTLSGARPSAGAAMTATTPTVSAAAMSKWAATVTQVAGRLRQLPSLPDDIGRVNLWLGWWQAYSTDETNYANWLRADAGAVTAPKAETASTLSAAIAAEASRADAVAGDNGLDQCVLAPDQ